MVTEASVRLAYNVLVTLHAEINLVPTRQTLG